MRTHCGEFRLNFVELVDDVLECGGTGFGSLQELVLRTIEHRRDSPGLAAQERAE
jgi:hypothetical protein